MNLKSIVSLMLIPLVLILVTTLLACTAPISAPASEPPSASTSTSGEIEKEADTPAMEPQHKDKLFGRYPCSADGDTGLAGLPELQALTIYNDNISTVISAYWNCLRCIG